jgi:hypothetical protein
MRFLSKTFLCLLLIGAVAGPGLAHAANNGWGCVVPSAPPATGDQTICSTGLPSGCADLVNPDGSFACGTSPCQQLAACNDAPPIPGASSTTPPAGGSTYSPPPLPINTNLPIPGGAKPISGPQGQGPASVVANFYSFAFLIAGFLAFVMIVYGGVRYTFSGGSSSSKEEAKDAIKQALLGLGLLLVAYLILSTINPDLTQLRMPTLPPYTAPPVASGTVIVPPPGVTGCSTSCTCQQYLQYQQIQHPGQTLPTSCTPDPGLQAVLTCLSLQGINPSTAPSDGQPSVVGGSHNPNSCHFGGRNCIGVGHAVDFSRNSIGSQTLTQAKAAAQQCGVSTGHQVSCSFETAAGTRPQPQVDGPTINHIHCNVDNASCNCS